jgi:hypothetical protein
MCWAGATLMFLALCLGEAVITYDCIFCPGWDADYAQIAVITIMCTAHDRLGPLQLEIAVA